MFPALLKVADPAFVLCPLFLFSLFFQKSSCLPVAKSVSRIQTQPDLPVQSRVQCSLPAWTLAEGRCNCVGRMRGKMKSAAHQVQIFGGKHFLYLNEKFIIDQRFKETYVALKRRPSHHNKEAPPLACCLLFDHPQTLFSLYVASQLHP